MDFNQLSVPGDTKQVDKLDKFNDNIDIYVKQRNGRKCITTIHGLGDDKDKFKIYSKDLRKLLGCSCSISEDQDELILKLSGKDTIKITEYLVNNLDIKKENIVVHGD